MQTLLKCLRVLSDIMRSTRSFCYILERLFCELLGKFADVFKMLGQRLLSAIVSYVGKFFHTVDLPDF